MELPIHVQTHNHQIRGLTESGTVKDERAAWVALFDSGTRKKDKAEIKTALRRGLEERVSRAVPAELDQRGISELPKDTTVAIVMVSAYSKQHFPFVKTLQEKGIIGRYVLIGYSSGSNSNRKFSDGTSMARRVFIPQEDKETLLANRDKPLLLIDGGSGTGSTYFGIGNALRRGLGYTGKIYQEEGFKEAVEWSGGNDPDYLPEAPPILTDRDKADRGRGIEGRLYRLVRKLDSKRKWDLL